jgi:hypothetical protein
MYGALLQHTLPSFHHAQLLMLTCSQDRRNGTEMYYQDFTSLAHSLLSTYQYLLAMCVSGDVKPFASLRAML